MNSLQELLAQQRVMSTASSTSLQSYLASGKERRPWDGFWLVTPISTSLTSSSSDSKPVTSTKECVDDATIRGARKHRLRDPRQSYVYLEQVEDRLTGMWWDGEARYHVEGQLTVSGKATDGAALRDSCTGALLTPVSFRAGYDHQSIECRFEWYFQSPVPPSDAVRLSRLDTPRIVAVTCYPPSEAQYAAARVVESAIDAASANSLSDIEKTDDYHAAGREPHHDVARSMTRQRPLKFVNATVYATSPVASVRFYGQSDFVPTTHATMMAMIDSGKFMTYRQSSDGLIAGIPADEVYRTLSTTAKTVVLPADTEDVTRLRAWRAPCAIAHLSLGGGSAASPSGAEDDARQAQLASLHRERLQRGYGPASVGKRTVGNFWCYEAAATDAEEAATLMSRELTTRSAE
jgi:hypothetical protein